MMTLKPVDIIDEIEQKLDHSPWGEKIMETLIEAGYLLGCAGKYDEAESCFRSILALRPDRIGGWLGLGNVLLMRGEVEESERAYETVLEEDPSDPAARAFLGELYLCTGRVDIGREILDSVYRDFPDSHVGNWAWNLLQLSREVMQCRD